LEQEAALEYAEDMLGQMLRRELHYMPGSDYHQWQMEGDAQMRTMLNEWLMEVIKAHSFRHETLFLTVSLVDRYLSLTRVGPSKLLLVGATAMLIATKFEEVKPPEVADLVQYTAGACSKREIVDMERSMLITLSFEITCPTAAHFFLQFRALEAACPAGEEVEEQQRCAVPASSGKKGLSGGSSPAALRDEEDEPAWRMLELALLDEQMLRHPPSRLAASALLVANRLSGRPGPHWPPALARLCQRSEGALEACARELRQRLLEADSREGSAGGAAGGSGGAKGKTGAESAKASGSARKVAGLGGA
jgi:cyclin B